jgi:branched-chain amino acid transport system ATP-binding protein
MLSIGRALMTNPTLLILDEATEGLAPLIVQEIWRVIGADPRNRHQHADRGPQLPEGAGQYGLGGGDGEGAHRAGTGESAGLLAEPKVLEELLGV